MTDPTAPAGNAGSSAQAEEQAIRERVRELTAQMLAGGRLDTEGVKEVVRGAGMQAEPGAQFGQCFGMLGEFGEKFHFYCAE